MSSVNLLYVSVPQIEPLPFQDKYQLVREMVVRYEYKGEVKVLRIPKGYVTDGATIPSALWQVIGTPYSPRFISAAIPHDKMYEDNFPVEEMSDLFFEILKDSFVGENKATLMREAVEVYTSNFKY